MDSASLSTKAEVMAATDDAMQPVKDFLALGGCPNGVSQLGQPSQSSERRRGTGCF
jgi:hypothetical protein